MDAVGLRELKNKLSEYVNLVKSGQSLLLTDRGLPVAEIRPVSPLDKNQQRRLSLDDLVRSGLLTPGKSNRADLYPSLTPAGGRSSAELLDEERGPR